MNPMRLRILLMLILLWGVADAARAQTVVRFQTSLGDIDVQLEDVLVPGTVTNFLNYVDDADYRHSFVHRTAFNPHVIQGGGFIWDHGWRFVPTDLPIADEVLLPNDTGTIAMAKTSAPDSATSQWYINSDANPGLDTGFTVFGHVIAGMDVVLAIHALPIVNLQGTPFGAALGTLPVLDIGNLSPFLPDDQLVFTHRVLRVADDQCGDANDDLVVDDLDPVDLRMHLADPVGYPLTPGGLAKCDTIGTAGSCDAQDVVVMLRSLDGMQPEIAPVCTAAGS